VLHQVLADIVSRQGRKIPGSSGGAHAEHRTQAYNGGLAGSRGEPLVRGKPPEAESILDFSLSNMQRRVKFVHVYLVLCKLFTYRRSTALVKSITIW